MSNSCSVSVTCIFKGESKKRISNYIGLNNGEVMNCGDSYDAFLKLTESEHLGEHLNEGYHTVVRLIEDHVEIGNCKVGHTMFRCRNLSLKRTDSMGKLVFIRDVLKLHPYRIIIYIITDNSPKDVITYTEGNWESLIVSGVGLTPICMMSRLRFERVLRDSLTKGWSL